MFYPDKAIELHKDYFSVHFNKGKAHENLGEALQAIESFAKSLALNPNDNRVRSLLGGVLLTHAKSLSNAEAVEYLLQAIKHVDDSIANIDAEDPRTLHLHCEIGNALGYDAEVNLQYCHAALGANSEKITNSNNEDVTLNLLGIISKEIGKHDDAIQYFDKGMAVNAESYDLLINIAYLHTDMDNYDLAKAYFEKAENLDDLLLCHGV